MANLSGIRLPQDSRYLRDVPRSKADDPAFMAAYDRHTLIYDAFYNPDTDRIVMIGPSFKRRNMIFLKGVNVKVDGKPVEKEIHQVGPRTGEIDIESPHENPFKLRFSHPGAPRLNTQIRINRSNHELFAGKNALVAISKNNKLSWISDWLKYYVREHGANAVVLFDNGSDAYRLRSLIRTVRSVEGIDAAEVISAPYPFGPKGVDRVSISAKFFHLSMLHIANRRFLGKANAVLSVDIDELVTKPAGKTVFETVKDTPQGFLSIPGAWRYAKKPETEGAAVRHQDHVLKRIGADAVMGPKWCIDPTGELAGRYWRVHGVSQAKHYYDHEHEFLHCRQISNGWDYDRDFESEDLFETAPEAETLRAVFAPDGVTSAQK